MNKNQFAVTPPMGWNSYDYYDTAVNEEQVKANADFMAKYLKPYGWEYIVVDIEWYSNDAGSRRQEYQYIPFGDDAMDEWGRLQPSPNRFPSSADGSGFTNLASYVHDLGLKFGIHIMRGIPRKAAQDHCKVKGTEFVASDVADPSSICGWNPDMYGVRNTEGGQAYYDSIISMYADWGVDFIKCDDICDSWLYPGDHFNGWFETEMIHKAIMKTGRPIVLSLSPGPAHIDRAWKYCANANMWRITDDFWDNWELLKNMFWRCELWQDHVKEGCFPDCDMLPLGKVGKGFDAERDSNFTLEEKQTMMTLWCMFRSPLMIGAELTKLTPDELTLLTNEKLLSMLGSTRKGIQLRRTESEAIWLNQDEISGEKAFALFNLSDEERVIKVTLDELGLEERKEIALHDLWNDTQCKSSGSTIAMNVPPHGVKAFTL